MRGGWLGWLACAGSTGGWSFFGWPSVITCTLSALKPSNSSGTRLTSTNVSASRRYCRKVGTASTAASAPSTRLVFARFIARSVLGREEGAILAAAHEVDDEPEHREQHGGCRDVHHQQPGRLAAQRLFLRARVGRAARHGVDELERAVLGHLRLQGDQVAVLGEPVEHAGEERRARPA